MATQQQIADHLGLGQRSISKYQSDGIIESDEPLDSARTKIVRHLASALAGRKSAGVAIHEDGDLDLTYERARLAQAQADKCQLELAVLERDHLHKDLVLETWSRMITASRARLLAIPHKLTPQLAAEADPAAVYTMLQDEIYAALDELSEVKVYG